jgi:hypothetical protein
VCKCSTRRARVLPLVAALSPLLGSHTTNSLTRTPINLHHTQHNTHTPSSHTHLASFLPDTREPFVFLFRASFISSLPCPLLSPLLVERVSSPRSLLLRFFRVAWLLDTVTLFCSPTTTNHPHCSPSLGADHQSSLRTSKTDTP